MQVQTIRRIVDVLKQMDEKCAGNEGPLDPCSAACDPRFLLEQEFQVYTMKRMMLEQQNQQHHQNQHE
jgi:hypothetical protein